MTSSLSGALTSSAQNVLVYDRTVPGLSPYQQLFQVPLGNPARIEAVWFFADFLDVAINDEAFVLSFNQADGSTMYTQQSPIIGSGVTLTAQVSFARGNVESGQVPAEVAFSIEAAVSTFLGPPLPEAVLPALATVNLALLVLNDDNIGLCNVSPYAVTYTVGSGPTSDTVTTQGIPLLTPTDSG